MRPDLISVGLLLSILLGACKAKTAPTPTGAAVASTAVAAPDSPPAPVAVREPPWAVSTVASGQPEAHGLQLSDGFVYWKTDNLETERGSISSAA